MRKLRFGIIGANGRGHLADWAHRPQDGIEVVAGMDTTKENLEKFQKRYQDKFKATVKGYLDYREMLEKEKLDGVFITSPDFTHEDYAVYALSQKVPVYLEKPMAITTAGCDRVMTAAKKFKTKLMLGHNMRYMIFTNKMKQLIDSGAIGEVKAIWCRHFIAYGGDAYFYDWHSERSKSTGLLLQKGAHDIDIIHWLAGSYTKRVIGFGNLSVYNQCERRKKNEPQRLVSDIWNIRNWPPLEQKGLSPKIDVEDLSMITMQLGNGVIASYQQCHYAPDACRNYTIIGTKGRIENYGDCGSESTVELWDQRMDEFRLHGDATFQTKALAGNHGGADEKIILGFIEYVRDNKAPATTPQAARYSVACGCAATESIRHNGLPVDVKPLSPTLENYQF